MCRRTRTGGPTSTCEWGDPANQARKRALQPHVPWRYLQGSGVHRGHLIGGCLEVLDWLRGTPAWPEPAQWDGAILFMETSEEAPKPTRVLRILRSLAAMGVLARLSGNPDGATRRAGAGGAVR